MNLICVICGLLFDNKMDHEQLDFRKLRAGKRRAITEGRGLVTAEPLFPERTLPLLVKPSVSGLSEGRSSNEMVTDDTIFPKIHFHVRWCASGACLTLWLMNSEQMHHRDTENTEVAQRNLKSPTFSARPRRPAFHKNPCSLNSRLHREAKRCHAGT